MRERIINPDILAEKLKNVGIKGILLDLDDTLIDTNALFDRWMKVFVSSVVEKNPNLSWNEVNEKFREINNDYFKTHAVNKNKFSIVAKDLDKFYDSTPVFTEHNDLLDQIYKNTPKFLDGATQMLDLFKKTGLPMALVTHANEDWTNLKVDRLNLRKYFDHIEAVDETRFKGSEDWLKAVKILGKIPEEVLVIGDNLKGDIISSHSIGVKHAVWIVSVWSIYREGDVPEGVIEVGNTKEVIPALIEKL